MKRVGTWRAWICVPVLFLACGGDSPEVTPLSAPGSQDAATETRDAASATDAAGAVESGPDSTSTESVDEPANLRVAKASTSEVELAWDAGAAGVSFRAAYLSGSTPPTSCSAGTTQSEQVIGAKPTATFSGLTAGSAYSFRVCSVKIAKSGQTVVSSGVTITKKLPFAPPGEVTDLLATVSGTTINVTWTAGLGAAKYRVVQAMSDTAPADCTSQPQTTTTTDFTITNATRAQTYALRVCAENGNAVPDVSAGVTTKVFVPPAPPPDPTGLTATALSATSFRVDFGNGGGTTAKFKITYKSGAAVPTSCSDGVSVFTADTTTAGGVTIPTVAAAPKYGIRVCAASNDMPVVNSAGLTTTVSLPVPGVSGLYCNPSTSSLTVRWTGGTQNYYFIERLTGSPPTACDDSGASFVVGSIGANSRAGGGALGDVLDVWICGYDAIYPQMLSPAGKLRVTNPKVVGGSVVAGSCAVIP